jgi:3-methyladenine DNA glycosylase AlkD
MSKAMKLATTLRQRLLSAGDPEKAAGMKSYMKSEIPCMGVLADKRRTITRSIFQDLSFKDSKEWSDMVLHIWRDAKYREERYAVMDLCAMPKVKSFQTLEALPMYEELIVTGAWWDLVDEIAAHRIGNLLKNHPIEMKKHMRLWSNSENMWKRRTSIICQLTLRKDTDLKLLYDCIEPSISSKEFFLRKAIGWALRAYARVDQQEVVRYVEEKAATLSPLSRREALKHVQSPLIPFQNAQRRGKKDLRSVDESTGTAVSGCNRRTSKRIADCLPSSPDNTLSDTRSVKKRKGGL